MVKIVKMLRNFYRAHLRCPNLEQFDEDIYENLQIYYLFGWYQPKPSVGRVIYGVFNFGFILVTIFLGALKNAIEEKSAGNLDKMMFNIVAAVFMVGVMTQVLLVAFNKSKLLKMLKEFKKLHANDDEEVMKTCRNNNLRLEKFHSRFTIIAASCCIGLKLIGANLFVLVIPAIYSELAKGSNYYPLLVFNIIHLFSLTKVLTACDCIYIVCMIRLVKCYNYLCEKLRHCTDSYSFRECQREQNKCIDYHNLMIK